MKGNKSKGKDKVNRNYFNIIINIVVAILFLISLFFNGVSYSKTKETNEINHAYDENIVFFGDSLTELYKLKKFYPNNKVVNSGKGGNKSVDLINRIEDVYNYNPSKVFLLIGINDLNKKVEEEDILYNIRTIIERIKDNRKNTEIYVESIYPLNSVINERKHSPFAEVKQETINDLNKKIKELCVEYNVTYIDVNPKLRDKNGDLKEQYTSDGVHLNDSGYLKVTSILSKYIK